MDDGFELCPDVGLWQGRDDGSERETGYSTGPSFQSLYRRFQCHLEYPKENRRRQSSRKQMGERHMGSWPSFTKRPDDGEAQSIFQCVPALWRLLGEVCL